MKKLSTILISSFLLFFIFSFNSSNVNAESVEGNPILTQEQQNAIDLAVNNLIVKVNEQLEQGKDNITEYYYVPEVNDFVSITISNTETLPQNNLISTATTADGRKSYRAEINALSFTHTLQGDFVYGKGKILSASKETQASGFTFSHTKSNSITELDPSVWQVQSTVKHKYLGAVGGVTGLGYTSYLTVELYGSGHYTLLHARYVGGV